MESSTRIIDKFLQSKFPQKIVWKPANEKNNTKNNNNNNWTIESGAILSKHKKFQSFSNA